METRRRVEQLSTFGKLLSKGERNRDLECVQDSQMEGVLSDHRDIHDCPGRNVRSSDKII